MKNAIITDMEKYELVFESDRIKYVRLSEGLIEGYLEMVNNPEVNKMIFSDMRLIAYEEEREWVRLKLKENAFCFSMIEKGTGNYIGNVEIIEIRNGVGEIGIVITPKQQNKHFGTEALKAIIKYGEENIGLMCFDLKVKSINARAIHCYGKVGFVMDGPSDEDGFKHMVYQHE